MLEWLKTILGDAYTDEIDKTVTQEIKKGYAPQADLDAKDRKVKELETQVGQLEEGAKVPYEMARDPKTNGGQDTLYTRQRKVFAPRGLSYEKESQASLSPANAELSDGGNWDLVHSGETAEAERSYIDDKAIALCRILSKG